MRTTGPHTVRARRANGETERYSWDKNGLNSTDGDAGSNKGEDHGYPWKDVETYRFKYVVAFSR